MIAALMLAIAADALARPQGAMRVSATVVRPHEPRLADALPMPRPGHVFQDGRDGRHYFFEGDLWAARDHFRAQMPQRGYALVNEQGGQADGHAMEWRRPGEVATVELRAVDGQAPTRVSVRVMLAP